MVLQILLPGWSLNSAMHQPVSARWLLARWNLHQARASRRIITKPLESVICVISGQATIRWGESLEFCCTAGPGDLVLVPAGVPYQAENASSTEVLHYCC